MLSGTKCEKPVINNVKGRLKISGEALNQLKRSLLAKNFTRHGNFVSLQETYSYNIFFGGTINVTGIKTIREVDNVAINFCKDFDIDYNLVDGIFVFDSTTASGQFATRIDLTRVQRYILQNKCHFTTAFNREVFCAIYCRSDLGGTCVLFSSGKFNILGCKTYEQVLAVHSQLCAIISHKTMSNLGSVYASCAERC